MTRKSPYAPPRGNLPVLQYLQPSQLMVDTSYQRSIGNGQSQRLIAAIARDWNWDLCQPLVVARRAGSGLFVVDGQHRLSAALLRGDISQLPCVIADYDSAQEEAAIFAKLNRQRAPLKQLDVFRAAVAGNDPEACRLMALITQAGLSLAKGSNNVDQAPGAVGNIGGIRESMRTWGDKSTLKALRILGLAFEGQVLRYAGTIFGGIAGTVGQADKDGTPVSESLLTSVLDCWGQADWYKDIMTHKGKFPEMRLPQVATHIISTAYQEAAEESEAA